MKMSDIVDLPLTRGDVMYLAGDDPVESDQLAIDEAIAHCVNSHDGLVRALENLKEACTSIRGIDMELYIPGVLAEVDRELARAKGE